MGWQHDALQRVHDALVCVQEEVFAYRGGVNKFLMDDKGSTLLACFGLSSPGARVDDAPRATLAALAVCARLFAMGFAASVGITCGEVFCGAVGSTARREYTVLGDTVNLAARLMQRAASQGVDDAGRPTGGVLVDRACRDECGGLLEFQRLAPITVKGKSGEIEVFRPTPGALAHVPLRAPLVKLDSPVHPGRSAFIGHGRFKDFFGHGTTRETPNIFKEMLEEQLRKVQVRVSN